MIRIIIEAMAAHPTVIPCNFVRDLSAEMLGPDDHVVEELCGFIGVVAAEFKANGLQLSATKFVFTASNKKPMQRLQERWEEMGLHAPYNKGPQFTWSGAWGWSVS